MFSLPCFVSPDGVYGVSHHGHGLSVLGQALIVVEHVETVSEPVPLPWDLRDGEELAVILTILDPQWFTGLRSGEGILLIQRKSMKLKMQL